MKMTLDYLVYQLNANGIEKLYRKSNRKLQFSHYTLIDEFTEYEEDCLYIVPYRFLEFLKTDADKYPIIVMQCPDNYDLKALNGIFISDKYTDTKVINSINHIFSDFNIWILYMSSTENLNLDLLLNYSTSIFHKPIVIINTEFRYVAKNYLYEKIDNTKPYVSKQIIDSIIWKKSFFEMYKKRGIFIYYSEDDGIDLLCYNLCINDKFYARLITNVHEKEYKDIINELFLYLANQIEIYFNKYRPMNIRTRKKPFFYEIINNILEGSNPENIDLINQYNWDINHIYQVILFRCDDYFPMQSGNFYMQNMIENLFPECCVLLKNIECICIRNISLENENEFYHSEISLFLRENIVKAGISNEFQGLMKINLYKHQAYEALELGEKKQPMIWYYFFKDYTYEYLLKQCTSVYPVNQLIHQELKILIEQDKQNNTALFNTLKIYLEQNLNTSKTAEILFIHRTTLMKRLNKIEKLTGIDFENNDTCLFLLLSYKILENIPYDNN